MTTVAAAVLAADIGEVDLVASLSALLSKHSGASPGRDGIPALRGVRYVNADVEDPPDRAEALGLVLVEGRLLEPLAGALDLLPRLRRLSGQMHAEGIRARIIVVDLYNGSEHRDGEVVLALRGFLRDVKQSYPRLAGALLVGRFPHATILRRWPWAPGFAEQVNGVATGGRRYLAWEPEFVAASADLVLADLMGSWPSLYRREVSLPTLRLLPTRDVEVDDWLKPDGRVRSARGAWELAHHTYEDVFLIDDGAVKLGPAVLGESLTATIGSFRTDPEARANQEVANRVAVPEIAVSRLDASHAAVRLPVDHNRAGEKGKVIGRGPLSTAGRPQSFNSSLRYATREAVGGIEVIADGEFEADPVLERRLLAFYLDRNQAHRTGRFLRDEPAGFALTHSFNPEAVADLLRRAVPTVQTRAREVGLARYAATWRSDALLRGITAHSFSRGSAFARGPQGPIDDAVGPIHTVGWWRSRPLGSSSTHLSRARVAWALTTTRTPRGPDSWLYRTLFQNGRVGDQPGLVLHGGCGVSTPEGFESLPFTHRDFGLFQNAESLLFYTGSLAMIARSKVFNDGPDDFVESLDEGHRRLGSAWRSMFARARSSDPEGVDIGEQAARCKKVYPWNLLGDWSVSLLPPRAQ